MNPVNLLVNVTSPWIVSHQTLALLIACVYMEIITLVATIRYCINYGGVLYLIFMGVGYILITVLLVSCGAWDEIVYGMYDNNCLMLGAFLMSIFTPLVSMPEPYCMRSDWGAGVSHIIYYCVFLIVFVVTLPCFVPGLI